MKKDTIYYEIVKEKKFKRMDYIMEIYCILISPFLMYNFVKISDGNLILYFSNWGLFEYGCIIILLLYSISYRIYLEIRYKKAKNAETKEMNDM